MLKNFIFITAFGSHIFENNRQFKEHTAQYALLYYFRALMRSTQLNISRFRININKTNLTVTVTQLNYNHTEKNSLNLHEITKHIKKVPKHPDL